MQAHLKVSILVVFGILNFTSGVGTSVVDAVLDADVNANRIVKEADRVRFPDHGFQVDVRITTLAPNRDPDVRQYRILSKGNDRTVVLTMAPQVDRGQIILMRDRDLWVFMPAVSQPVRLPLSQRLTGQVANGDLARANFAGDYDATLLSTESIGGHHYYVLELEAARRGVTYKRVVYWVNQSNYHPYKAEFYTVSGHLLKRAYYRKFAKMDRVLRPTQLVIEDLIRGGERSIMDYSNMRQRDLPDKVFSKFYLKKLQ